MLEVLRNDNEDIIAVCEWNLVDALGHFDQRGEFVWINEVEVSKSYRNGGILKEFIKILCARVPWAKYGYFTRGKYNKRQRLYSRKQWLDMVKEK